MPERRQGVRFIFARAGGAHVDRRRRVSVGRAEPQCFFSGVSIAPGLVRRLFRSVAMAEHPSASMSRRELLRRGGAAMLAAGASALVPLLPLVAAAESTATRRGNMNHPRLSKQHLARMHDVMSGYVERGEVPGLITLVAHHDDIEVDVIGAAAEHGPALRRDSIFRIASMSKPITAVAALMLVEECKLRLDDPVDRFLPELAQRRVLKRLDGPLEDTVPAQRPISLRDLLTFRLGFGQLMAAPDAYPILKAASALQIGMGPPNPDGIPAPDEWLRRLGSLPLMYQPGQRWLYHTGSDVLGTLIARASGQSFDSFLSQRIFEPLGMKDTAFFVPAEKLERLVSSYVLDATTHRLRLNDPGPGGQWSRPPAFPSGGGGLCSTVDDYYVFADMLRKRGRHGSQRLLSGASIEVMTTDQLTEAQKAVSGLVPDYFESHGWGMGVSVVTRAIDPAQAVGSYGWDGGFGTSFRIDPDRDTLTILLGQCAWTSPDAPSLCRDFWTSSYLSIAE
jgi:CubicO group peptidase (beta-lactamase class C family)